MNTKTSACVAKQRSHIRIRSVVDRPTDCHASCQSTSLVVLSSNGEDHSTTVGEDHMLVGVPEDASVVILDPDQDGINQISEALSHHHIVTNLYIVSYGSPGCIYLGSTQLNLDGLERYAWDLQTWFANLPSFLSPQIFIYGCNVASGDVGAEFLERLHQLTGAAIASASTLPNNLEK